MAQTSRPWQSTAPGDAGPYSSANWHDIYKYLFHALRPNSGAIIDSGTAPNVGLQVQATSPASAAVDVLAGAALVEGAFYENTATVTLSIAANLSGNPRIDTIVLQKDYVAQTVRLALLTGTPAVSPVPPSLTQSDGVLWQIPLADVAVASGFVSIANSNITPRHEWANAADGVYLKDILNNSGQTLQTGDVVIWDSTADRAVTTTTTRDDRRVAGVWIGRTLNGAYGRVLKSGVGYVKVGAAVTRGNRLGTGTTATAAAEYNTVGRLGVALQSTGGAGLCLALIDARQAVVDIAKLWDSKAQNTAGGSMVATTWTTRDLNSEIDTNGIVSLAANLFTPIAGVYEITVVAPFVGNSGTPTSILCRLLNNTAGIVPTGGYSSVERAQVSDSVTIVLNTVFEANGVDAYAIQYYSTQARATDGLGLPINLASISETYTTVTLKRIS